MFERATHLGRWREGEMLYSLCARHHHISGNSAATQTSIQLFGTGRAAAHDLPHHLDAFVTRTGASLGLAEEIALERTILPFYLRFVPPEGRRNILAAVRAGGCGSLKAQLGMPASRFGAAHPLKSCPSCESNDEGAPRAGHWRVADQWPGVWTCLRCGELLSWTSERVNGGNRFTWLLPRDCTFQPPSTARISSDVLRVVSSFSKLVEGMVTLPIQLAIDGDLLQRTYLGRLLEMDLAKPSGRLNIDAICSRILPTTQALRLLREFESLPSRAEDVEVQFMRLLRGIFRSAHPLRHLVLIQALFADWPTFWSHYQRVSRTSGNLESAAECPPVSVPGEDPRRRYLVDLIGADHSVSAASRQIGISVATGIAWAASAGVRTPKRASLLTEKRRRRAVFALRNGAEKARVAKLIRMSVSTINMLLKSEPGLRAQWQEAVFTRRQSRARAAWTKTASRVRTINQKQLRTLQPAVFAWLYRNDRAWLSEFALTLTPGEHPAQRSVDWDERDRELARSVQSATAALHDERGNRVVRLSTLCDRVPGLKRKLSKLDKLPLTRRALALRSKRV